MIRLCSFSYKNGPVPDPVKYPTRIDCRAVANPWNVPELKHHSGLGAEVQRFVMGDPKAERIVKDAVTLASGGVPVALAFGCVGGFGRSVAIVETIARQCSQAGVKVEIEHLSLGMNKEIIP